MRRVASVALLLLGACHSDPDTFNDKQSTLLCRLADKCDDWDFGIDTEGSCEDDRRGALDRCAQVCEFDERAARTCITHLRKALRPRIIGPDCNLDRRGLEACAEVYRGCEPEPDETLACDVPRPSSLCSVAPGSAPPAALLLLPWWRRRRRR